MQPSSSSLVGNTVDFHARSTSGDEHMQPSSSLTEPNFHARSTSGDDNRQPSSSFTDPNPRTNVGFSEGPVATPVSVVGEQQDQGMDIDWLTVDEARLPLRITRTNAACTDTVDFTEGMWDFSKLGHREAATKLIEDNKPGLIIGEELKQNNTSREDALGNFHSKIRHAEYLSTLYTQQSNRGLYYLHVVLSDPKSSAVGISRMRDLETCPRHQQVK
jgi:hypothetical protein